MSRSQSPTPHRPPARGFFLTLEGIEGSGKSTQARLLADWLRALGREVVATREPGGTALAEAIRGLLLHHADEPIAPETEAFLIMAARRQHVQQVIAPALARGAVVLCDRFSDSTLAYQGYARGLDGSMLRRLDRAATGAVRPQLTLLFDLPVAVGLRRRRKAAEQNRLDRESLRFHRQVRDGFLALARRHPRRIVIIAADRAPAAVHQSVVDAVAPRFARASRNSRAMITPRRTERGRRAVR